MSKRKSSEKLSWGEIKMENLNLKDLRTLLSNRETGKVPGVRKEMEDMLKTKPLEIDYKEDMTIKQLQVELKLLGLDATPAKKDVLLQRLAGDIDAPPKKKTKSTPRARKHKAHGAKIFVTISDEGIPITYIRHQKNFSKFVRAFFSKKNWKRDVILFYLAKDEEGPKVIGVYAFEQAAYNAAIGKLLEVLKKKDEKRYEEVRKDAEGPASADLFKKVLAKCASSYNSGEAPDVRVIEKKVQ
ncbi:hypothetical protein RFI_10839 [Reticulomyxa filosa]|uniref:SAP domain-containing protein n=1 Tax=Reticulomyxa filosa TaxID=46433 RepID=X6NJ01_RETFI|nr:hypothetical protein RFI_10839 [Reticulomyxa filosa]|eukprot:ETO26305.1 hypothetical protein RFI_10839 [Reticulomyxa filosa]